MVVVKSQLDVGDSVDDVGHVGAAVLVDEPLFQLVAQIVFKFNHCVVPLLVVIFDSLVEGVPLVLADLALDREVSHCDQLAVEELLVDRIRALVIHNCVFVDHDDQEAEDGGSEAKEIF